jgi:threonine aldolase
MYSFKNDYSDGTHPSILQALINSNATQQQGYGDDYYSKQASDLIRKKLKSPDSAIYFVSGGTQANLTVISSCLRPYQSVISANSGHISHHETGAIEATGHKVENVPSQDGKLTPLLVSAVLQKAESVHVSMPRMVYISNSTEIGTHYMKDELVALWEYCQANRLYLYMDGARLASGLDAGDISFADLARYTDAFYIGGTKNGTLLGEAIVINNTELQEHFRYNMKMRGALLAKGRLLGIQFIELFKENLFFEIGAHLNQMAAKLAAAFDELGYDSLTVSKTNQVFPILPYSVIEKLQEKYDFYVWQKVDNHQAAIRLVTSWSTQEAAIDAFIADLKIHSLIKA